jgi:fatty acid desaturase
MREGEIARLEEEIETLNRRIELNKQMQFQDKISQRGLPPLSSLSRTQKRFLLEPWFTTGMIVSGVIAAGCLITAAALWNWRWMWLGVIAMAAAGCFGFAKFVHQDMNVRVEGEMSRPKQAKSERYPYDYR